MNETQHAQQVLQVNVDVYVTLARKQMKLDAILDLAPGSILTFDKTCDDPLELEISGKSYAFGEAVKVGDKFGLRVRGLGPIDQDD